MKLIRINYHDGGIDRSNLAGFNNVGAAGVTGVKVANLIDYLTELTGVSLTQSVSLTATGAVVQADSAPNAEFPLEFYRSHFYPASNSTVELAKLTGLPPGAAYTLKISANHGGTTQTSFTATGGTPSPAVYNNAGQKDPVPAPVEITGTVPENGEVSITFGATGFARANGFSIEYEEATGPSITTADDITSEGQTATFTLAGNTDAPVSATLNGTDVGDLTLVSGRTYSFAAPLLLDDDTASLVVTVDSTTASATISYANSYPYVLTQHGTPNVNSIFADVPGTPTQFASNDPVEWGVVTDYDSAIVTVNHAAMDAAEDELNGVALHSTEASEGTTTATYKYFVQESGATGTWQATIVVSGEGDNGGGTVTIGSSLRPRRIGSRKAVRPATNPASYQAIYRS